MSDAKKDELADLLDIIEYADLIVCHRRNTVTGLDGEIELTSADQDLIVAALRSPSPSVPVAWRWRRPDSTWNLQQGEPYHAKDSDVIIEPLYAASPSGPEREAIARVTDEMCEAALKADSEDRIQGFSYTGKHVIRDVWLPAERQTIWSAPVRGPDEYQAFQKQCRIEGMRKVLEAALHPDDKRAGETSPASYCALCDLEHELHEDAKGFHHVIKGERMPCASTPAEQPQGGEG